MTKAEKESIVASIKEIKSLPFGYPKRVTVDPTRPHAAAWQRFFDWQYELIVAQLSAPTLFDASHTA